MAGFGQTFNQLVQQQQTPATTGQGMNEDWFTQFGGTGTPLAPNQLVTEPGWTVGQSQTGTIQPIPGQGTPSAPGTVITQNPGGTSGSAPGGDPWQSFESILGVQQGGTLSPQMLLAKEQELKAAGITLIKNAAGLPGKVQFANGAAYDVIQGAGDGTNKYQRLPLNAAAGGTGGGQAGQAGGFGGMTFNSPYQNFTPPSMKDFQNSDAYQFAQDQANRGIQSSAAAKGTLLTGSTLKALAGYDTGLANQFYDQGFNRAFQTNQANFNNGLSTNQLNTGNLFNLAKLGMPQ